MTKAKPAIFGSRGHLWPATSARMDQEQTYHYQIIKRAIDQIDQADAPLSLEELAEEVGLSPAHFQRTFTQWAGVSPKRYQQYLTLDHAKTLLRDHFTTLDTAHAVGLSGSSRLHDLFLRWEAMAPGDYAKGGANLTVRWAQLLGATRSVGSFRATEPYENPGPWAAITGACR